MLFKSSSVSSSVLDMLREDHQKVQGLFDEFEEARDSRKKQRIAGSALTELEIHAALEEELIYPAIRPELDDDKLMDEAIEEHHVVHILIGELKKMKPSDDRFDAKFIVLAESVKHHIKEEESEMFPKAEDCEIDWEALEVKVQKRREQLMSNAEGRPQRSGRTKKMASAKKR